MNCSRCHGLMVRDHFLDYDGTIGHTWANGHRCMNCGNVQDPVIEQHRNVRKRQALALPHGGLDSRENELVAESHAAIRRAA